MLLNLSIITCKGLEENNENNNNNNNNKLKKKKKQLPSRPPGNHQPLSPSFWILIFEENYLTSNLLLFLDDWATPEVDALSAPKLDKLLNQVRKFVQERDKEMFNVQRAFLNATGPLCGLHDCIENGSAPTYEEIKVALEQTLCLLGSANAQLSILRRQRVLCRGQTSQNYLYLMQNHGYLAMISPPWP